jgi:hypothetical protein
MRCGLCAQGLQCSATNVNSPNGEVRKITYWRTVRSEVWCWCTHTLPHVREATVDAYMDSVLAPLLLADLRERAAANADHTLASEQARLQRELGEAERRYRDDLPTYVGKVSAQLLGAMEQKLLDQIAELRRQFGAVANRIQRCKPVTWRLAWKT